MEKRLSIKHTSKTFLYRSFHSAYNEAIVVVWTSWSHMKLHEKSAEIM